MKKKFFWSKNLNNGKINWNNFLQHESLTHLILEEKEKEKIYNNLNKYFENAREESHKLDRCYIVSEEIDLININLSGKYGSVYAVKDDSYIKKYFKQKNILVKIFHSESLDKYRSDIEEIKKNAANIKESCSMNVETEKNHEWCSKLIEYNIGNNVTTHDINLMEYVEETYKQIVVMIMAVKLLKIFKIKTKYSILNEENADIVFENPKMILDNTEKISKIAEEHFLWNLFLGCAIVYRKETNSLLLGIIMKKYDRDARLPPQTPSITLKQFKNDAERPIENIKEKFNGPYTSFHEAKILIHSVLQAVAYLELVGLSHHDVKLANIFYEKKNNKITHFVLSDWGVLRKDTTDIHNSTYEKAILQYIETDVNEYVRFLSFKTEKHRVTDKYDVGECITESLGAYYFVHTYYTVEDICFYNMDIEEKDNIYLIDVCTNPQKGNVISRAYLPHTPLIYSVFTHRLNSVMIFSAPSFTYVYNIINAYDLLNKLIKNEKEKLLSVEQINKSLRIFKEYSFVKLIKNLDELIENNNYRVLMEQLLDILNLCAIKCKIEVMLKTNELSKQTEDENMNKVILPDELMIKDIINELHKMFVFDYNEGRDFIYTHDLFGLNTKGYIKYVYEITTSVLNKRINLQIARIIHDVNKENIRKNIYYQFYEPYDIVELEASTTEFIQKYFLKEVDDYVPSNLEEKFRQYAFAYLAGIIGRSKTAWNNLNDIIIYSAVKLHEDKTYNIIETTKEDFFARFFELFEKNYIEDYGSLNFCRSENTKNIYGISEDELRKYIMHLSWRVFEHIQATNIWIDNRNMLNKITNQATDITVRQVKVLFFANVQERIWMRKILQNIKKINNSYATLNYYRTYAMFKFSVDEYLQQIINQVSTNIIRRTTR